MSDVKPARRQTLAEILAEQSGPRECVLDEHMYEVKDRLSRGTFRIQLFTADGLRPVAVATQDETEGWSLVNGCEDTTSGFVTDSTGRSWFVSCSDLPDGQDALPLDAKISWSGSPRPAPGKKYPQARSIQLEAS